MGIYCYEALHPLPCPGRDVECDSECGSSGDTRHGGGGQAHHQDQPQHRQGSGAGPGVIVGQ